MAVSVKQGPGVCLSVCRVFFLTYRNESRRLFFSKKVADLVADPKEVGGLVRRLVENVAENLVLSRF